MNSDIKYKYYYNKLKKYRLFVKGMKNKYILVPNINNEFVPQGFCFVDDYTLVTLYDSLRKRKSVICLLDKDGELIKVVSIDGKYHCGGIAYHKRSNSIYITGDSGINNGKSSYVNKYNFFDILTKDRVCAVSKYKVDNDNTLESSINGKSSVAYLTINENDIYLGNFTLKKVGKIKKYKLDNNGNIIFDSCVVLDNIYKKTQGLSIYKYNGNEYFLFSTSYGRVKDSVIYISKLSSNKFKTIKKIKFPVMSEQINVDNFREVSVMFESGVLKFKGVKNRINDICFFDLKKFL